MLVYVKHVNYGGLQKIVPLTLVALTMTLTNAQGQGVSIGPSIMSVSCTVTEILQFEFLVGLYHILYTKPHGLRGV
jgi:hypothetical protein